MLFFVFYLIVEQVGGYKNSWISWKRVIVYVCLSWQKKKKKDFELLAKFIVSILIFLWNQGKKLKWENFLREDNSENFQFQNVVLRTHPLCCAVNYPSTREATVHHERYSLAVEHRQQGHEDMS